MTLILGKGIWVGCVFRFLEVMFFDKSSQNSPKCILIPFTALDKCSCVLVEPERQMNHNALNACYNRQVPPPVCFYLLSGGWWEEIRIDTEAT